MNKPVIILGANGIGKAAAEIFNSQQIIIFGYLDDNKDLHNTEIMEVMVLGKTTDDGVLKYIGQKCEAFVATDDNSLRKSLVDMLVSRRKTMPMNAIVLTTLTMHVLPSTLIIPSFLWSILVVDHPLISQQAILLAVSPGDPC